MKTNSGVYIQEIVDLIFNQKNWIMEINGVRENSKVDFANGSITVFDNYGKPIHNINIEISKIIASNVRKS